MKSVNLWEMGKVETIEELIFDFVNHCFFVFSFDTERVMAYFHILTSCKSNLLSTSTSS